MSPWLTTIVDLDTGQVLGIVDGRDHKGVGDRFFARPLHWRLGGQVVAIDPSALFRKTLRMWLPRTAVGVDHFQLVSLANQAMSEARQNLSQQVKRLPPRLTRLTKVFLSPQPRAHRATHIHEPPRRDKQVG